MAYEGQFPIARGLVKYGYRLEDYKSKELTRLRLASALLYMVAVVSLATTIFIYNPDNAFGDTLLASPQTTVIQPSYDTGCSGLTPYAVASDLTLGTLVVLRNEGAISLEMTFRNYTQQHPDNNAIFTVTSTGQDMDGAILGNNQSIDVTDQFGTETQNFSVELTLEVVSTILFTGDPNECTSFFAAAIGNFAEACLQPQGILTEQPDIVCSEITEGLSISLRRSGVFVFTSNTLFIFGDYQAQPVAINTELLEQQFNEIYCLSTGEVNSLQSRVGPYSCVVSTYRGWLEVLALSFSNATLFYAIMTVVLFYSSNTWREESNYPKPAPTI